MAIYEATQHFQVERQADAKSCWASAVQCFLRYLYPGWQVHTQQALTLHHPPGDNGNRPDGVLKRYFVTSAGHKMWAAVANNGAPLNARRQELVDFLHAHLPPPAGHGGPAHGLHGPLLGSLGEANNVAWPLQAGGNDYDLKHAIITYKYDDVQQRVWFMDPARGPHGGAAESFDVGLDDFLTGFQYMTQADFGPVALARFVPGALPAVVNCRIKSVRAFAI